MTFHRGGGEASLAGEISRECLNNLLRLRAQIDARPAGLNRHLVLARRLFRKRRLRAKDKRAAEAVQRWARSCENEGGERA